jgi:hypothetical protein
MGSDGWIPPLHVGGEQDAMTAPAPMPEAETIPTLPYTVLLAPEAPTETGLLELQVRGTPVRVIPRISVTVAFKVVEVPEFTTKEVAGFPSALREMVCTGQVVNCTGWLLTPLAEAKTEVEPGEFAVAVF